MSDLTLPQDQIDKLFCEDFVTRRLPDRRWRIVTHLLETQSTFDAHLAIDDPFVRQAFCVEHSRQNVRTLRTYKGRKDIFAAIELGLMTPGQADLVKAYLLAGQTPSEVASLTGQPEGVVAWFERLFFDARKRLDARDWVWAFILAPANHAIHKFNTGSPEYERAIDRAVLFDVAYRGGMELLKRIVSPISDISTRSNSPLLMCGSPLTRILKWLKTTEASFPVCVQVLDRIQHLLGNAEFEDDELARRLEVLAGYVEHGGKSRSRKTINACRESGVSEMPKVTKPIEESTVQADDSTPTAPDSPCSESTAA